MTQQEFLSHLDSLIGNEKTTFIEQFGKNQDDIDRYIAEYDPEQHDVMSPIKRPDKNVRKPSGRKNDITGEDILIDAIQNVTRISVDLQQEVTKSASGILCANKIELVGASDEIQKIWDDNKLDLKTISICNYWLSETEVAELWYKNADNEDKVMVLANSLGDRLYPIFDENGKMVCFIRKYASKEIMPGNSLLQEINYYEIYTESTVVKGNDKNNGIFEFADAVPHGYDKIPVIYCQRDKPIWSPVQTSISRWEVSVSNLCDTNDYVGSPILASKGRIISFADKGESGKMIELEPDATLEYITWDHAPESIKLEWETLRAVIYNSTRTVSLSLDNLKGLFGSAPSSYAIKLLFTPAHMQAAEHEEIFGEYIQRRLNFIASFTGAASGSVMPKFTYYLPKNDKEELANIISAHDAGILSTESAVADSPLTVNDDEFKKITDENKAAEKTATNQVRTGSNPTFAAA